MNVQLMVCLDYTRQWREFANILFKLEEADPGYMLLARAKLTYGQKLRYVLAWCTFYNPGIAAIASEYKGSDFYQYLRNVYPTAKRGSERRHFRGQAGLKALAQWEAAHPNPEDMVEYCFGSTYMQVRRNMQNMAQMGEYFYWKMADIQDSVFGLPVDFTGCERYMPKVPKQGAEIINSLEHQQFVNGQYELEDVMSTITEHVGKLKHPFKPHRPLMLQEAETVCCVFKQHVSGKYKFGFRSAKAFNRLRSAVGSDSSSAAVKLLEGLYAGGIWNEKNLKQIGEYL